jgi:hypothetical protein
MGYFASVTHCGDIEDVIVRLETMAMISKSGMLTYINDEGEFRFLPVVRGKIGSICRSFYSAIETLFTMMEHEYERSIPPAQAS